MKIKSILKKIKNGSIDIQLSEEKSPADKLKNDALKTIECLKREYCSGCGACLNVCPVSAISMEYDDEGFLSPVVDSSKCSECGLCRKICPSMNPVYKNAPRPVCYAAYTDEKVRQNSSSGGIFTLAAEEILNSGGRVCGAAMTDGFVVKHIIIDSANQLDMLRKSKYVQSDTGNVYSEIKKFLNENIQVLFCGCPCQVAGLYAALQNTPTDKLYTIDLMCHGSPSPGVFRKYIDSCYDRSQLEFIGFREKDYFGWSTEMTVKFKDGSIKRASRLTDPYYKAFLPCLSTRGYCGNCEFSKLPRQGDITLADFWGVERFDKKLTDGKGTSIVSVNSQSGKELFEKIKKRLAVCSEIPIEHVLSNGQPFDKTFKSHPARKMYFEYIKNGASLEKAYDYAVNRKFDAAIYGVWFGCNYGSVATYYALHEILRSFGLNVIMIDKPMINKNDPEHGNTHSRRFAKEHYEISRIYSLRELKTLNRHVDTFIMGSDQVWNRGISRPFGMSYYLDFVDESKKKISYAASFGHDKDFSGPGERAAISEYMKKFDGISVREKSGVDICRDVYGVEAVQVLDAVFAADRRIFDELADNSQAACSPVKKKYIAAYILDPTPEKRDALLYAAEYLNCELVVMLDGVPWKFEENKKRMNLDRNVIENLTTESWLYYIKNSSFVITDSCHGLSFAIIYEKPFIGIANPRRGGSRFDSLLDTFDLKEHYVTDPSQIKERTSLFETPDYKTVGSILERERKKSLDWLKNAIFSPKKINSHCVYPVCDKRLEKEL